MGRKSLSLLWAVAWLGFRAGSAEPVEPPRPAHPNWRLDLLLSAPQIRHPSVVCAAPDGRIFIGEDPMDISNPRADAAEGRILCRHPDGRVTVFADKLYAPFGLHYLEGRLYVLHNPKFSVFEDGGDRALNRLDLIEQTNPNASALDWNDHIPANFRLGMDGYFYMAVGDKGIYGAVGRDGKRVDMPGGGILRLRPDGTELETFCLGVRNIMDVALNSEDELFTYDNTDEHEWMGRLTHMVEGGFYGYPHDFIPQRPYTLWCFGDFGAGAATGALAYTEDALPPEFDDNLLLADFGKRQVLRVRVARDGGTYRVTPPPSKSDTNAPSTTPGSSSNLLPGTNPVATLLDTEPLFLDAPEDFRPVGIALGADGQSILITDWQHRDSKDTNAVCGRLWQLTWTGPTRSTAKPAWFIPASTGKAFNVSTEELVAALGHPSREVRLCAQRRLSERGKENPEIQKPVAAVLTDPQSKELARIHALWALDAMDGGLANRAKVLELLKDKSLSLRRQAIRQVGLRRVQESWRTLMPQLWHEDAGIRRAVATAMGRMGDMASGQRILASLDDSDLFARFAKFTALNRIGARDPRLWTHVIRRLETDRADLRATAMFAMRETYDAQLLDRLTFAAHDAQRSLVAREAALELIAAIHRQPEPWRGQWGAYHPFRNPAPPKIVPWAGTEKVRAVLNEFLGSNETRLRRKAIQGLAAAHETNSAPKLREVFSKEQDLETRRALLEAFGAFADSEATPLCAAVLGGSPTSKALVPTAIAALEQIRTPAAIQSLSHAVSISPLDTPSLLLAVQALGRLKNPLSLPVLTQTLQHPEPTVVQAAIAALGRIGGNDARSLLESLVEGDSPERRHAAIQALGSLADRASVPVLLKAWQNPNLRAESLVALTRVPDVRATEAFLDGLGSRNSEVRAQSRAALKTIRNEARPIIEGRAASLPALVQSELQSLFRDVPEAQAGPIFKSTLKTSTPEEFLRVALEGTGEATRGRKLFADAAGLNCIGCHRVAGEGGDVGPDLSGIGAQSDRRGLAESILYPSKVVREGYQRIVIELKDGDEVAGLIKSETTDSITLRDAAGQLQVLKKADVRERRQTPDSMMPEGLQSGLSPDEFRDLVSYLTSLRGDPKSSK